MNLCQHPKVKKILEYPTIILLKCYDCALIFQKEKDAILKRAADYNNYYKDGASARFNYLAELIVKLFRLWRAFKIFVSFREGKDILDIGSGRGFTLYYLKKYFGFRNAVGTQISKPARQFSRDKLGLKMHGEDLLDIDFGDEKFNIISIIHVLEHVAEPEAYIKKIYELLNKDGSLIIETPNFNAWVRRLTGKYWLALDPKHHVYFFTPNALIDLLRKHGFKIKTVNSFSLEYSVYTSTQSLVSFLTRSDHVLFVWLQSGQFRIKILFYFLLFIIFAPICFLINLLLYFSKQGEVIYIEAQKT